jgi:hypothetical protein
MGPAFGRSTFAFRNNIPDIDLDVLDSDRDLRLRSWINLGSFEQDPILVVSGSVKPSKRIGIPELCDACIVKPKAMDRSGNRSPSSGWH